MKAKTKKCEKKNMKKTCFCFEMLQENTILYLYLPLKRCEKKKILEKILIQSNRKWA